MVKHLPSLVGETFLPQFLLKTIKKVNLAKVKVLSEVYREQSGINSRDFL